MKNKKQHILIVDDVTTNLRCLAEIMRDNYVLSMAKSGDQAIKMLDKIHPNLILLDVKMPGLDGYETMKRIRTDSHTKDIPIIFLTADTELGSELKGLKMGASDFIKKPFEPDVMIERIERVLAQEERNSEVRELAYRDPLTGIWNRKYLEEEIERFALEESNTGTFLLMDLDNFKGINDNYGHAKGDRALVEFSAALSAFVHKDDIVARIGGDEFAVFLKNAVGKDLLTNRIAGLIKDVEKKLCVVKEDNTITGVSVGISSMPFDGTDFVELYNNADKALYYVKRNGKSGFHFYNPCEHLKIEKDRVEAAADLDEIKNMFDESEQAMGPFDVDCASFENIYRFLKRYVTRTHQKVQVVLLSIKDAGIDLDNSVDHVFNAMSVLESSIRSCLRKNDVFARYSNSQYLVILMDVCDDNKEIVLRRIINRWEGGVRDSSVLLQYDIEDILED